ncbi:MAG TPA: hypothetical protein VIG30_19405 [Ktedonobacterales bacterium]|jgi:hypothetical protein
MRTTAHHPHARLALTLAALFAALVAATACNPPPPKPLTYSGTWQGQQVKLALVSNPPLVRLTGLTPQGQLTNFTTNDAKYACFNNKSLNVYQETQDYSGSYVVYSICTATASGQGDLRGVWTFPQPAQMGTIYPYSAIFQDRTVILTLLPTTTLPTDAELVSQVTGFFTTSPTYNCLNQLSLPVYSDPKHYSGQYLVYFPGCPSASGNGSAGLWEFSITYSYSGTFQNQTVELTARLVDNPAPPTQSPVGLLTAFSTDDPSYACQNSASLYVYAAPQELQQPNLTRGKTTYAVYGDCPSVNIPGVWTFVADSETATFTYTAIYQGKPVTLTPVAPVPAGFVAVPGAVVTGFATDDATYFCLRGGSLQVWKSQTPGDKRLLAYPGICGNSSPAGAWLFTP